MDGVLTSALQALPIFPLPDVVLFPGALLPLHVFEERYRRLTADVLAGAKLVGMPQLRPGYEREYDGRPAVYDVAGIGYVIASEQLSDGRYNIVLRGVGRVRIAEELPREHLYRSVRAELLVDTHTARPDDLSATHDQLIALCDRLSDHLEDGGESLRELVRALPSPASCVDVVSAAIIADPAERQALLETLDPADRLDRVLRHVARLVSRFGPGSSSLN